MNNPFSEICTSEQVFIRQLRLACVTDDNHTVIQIGKQIPSTVPIHFEAKYLDGQVEFLGELSIGENDSIGNEIAMNTGVTLSMSGLGLSQLEYLQWLSHKQMIAELTLSDESVILFSPIKIKTKMKNDTSGLIIDISLIPTHYNKCNGCIVPTDFVVSHICN